MSRDAFVHYVCRLTIQCSHVKRTKKEKEEKKRKKEESTAFDPRFTQQLRKQDKKKDDVEVEGQGLTLFEDEEVNDDQRPTYAGHVVAVVERQAGQLFAGTLGILRPSSAATKEKQGMSYSYWLSVWETDCLHHFCRR